MERNVVAIVLGVAVPLSSTVWGQENLEWPPGTTDEQMAEACNQRGLERYLMGDLAGAIRGRWGGIRDAGTVATFSSHPEVYATYRPSGGSLIGAGDHPKTPLPAQLCTRREPLELEQLSQPRREMM